MTTTLVQSPFRADQWEVYYVQSIHKARKDYLEGKVMVNSSGD